MACSVRHRRGEKKKRRRPRTRRPPPRRRSRAARRPGAFHHSSRYSPPAPPLDQKRRAAPAPRRAGALSKAGRRARRRARRVIVNAPPRRGTASRRAGRRRPPAARGPYPHRTNPGPCAAPFSGAGAPRGPDARRAPRSMHRASPSAARRRRPRPCPGRARRNSWLVGESPAASAAGASRTQRARRAFPIRSGAAIACTSGTLVLTNGRSMMLISQYQTSAPTILDLFLVLQLMIIE